jgi:2-polyprenyl-3-methyl-5-hydroxy-6-metoxy-1,4-benzoquinol methylase
MSSIALTDRDGCPLCGGRKAVTFIPFPSIPVVRCGSCSFLYSSRVFADGQLATYYEEGFGGTRHRQGQLVNASVNSMVLERLVEFGAVATLLDVGTGYGFLLKELSAHHELRATGVEVSRQEAGHAKQVLGLDVRNCTLAESGLERESHDLVTTFEVIEHVPHPRQFLAELADYVKPGGHLVVMTDNFDSRMAQSLGAAFPKWIPHSHISHFAPRTLTKAIEATGTLDIVRSLSYTPWEVLLRDAYYKLRGIRKQPAEAFDLEGTLAGEMRGTYKLFSVRKLLNRSWARMTISERMDGDLIYFLCRKKRRVALSA